MLQLITNCTSPTLKKEKRINFSINPPNIFNLNFLLHTRIFVFEKTGGSLYIDFTEQPIVANCMYIVPPLHFHHLNRSNQGDFVCIDIDNLLLQSHHKKLLFAIKYSKQKSLPALNGITDDCTYATITALPTFNQDERYIISKISSWIEGRIPSNANSNKRIGNFRYIEIADQFLTLLTQKTLTLDTCQANSLASEMFCSERNLHRICKAAFGLCAKDVLYYHLVMKAIYLLAENNQSISDIAAELNFSSVAVFDRYIRRGTGSTPSEIRAALRAAGL